MARIMVLLVTAGFTATYFLVAIPRVLYPYDLDFVEDGILMAALRTANQQPVYIPPQAEFVPHVYMPLYTWLGGLLFTITRPGYMPLRWLSLGSVLAICGLLYWIGRRESGHTWLGLVCAGLFLGGYRLNGFWYELARVDSLFVALSLAGLTLGVYGAGSRLGLMGAAIGLALAFLAKQTGIILGIGLGVYLLVLVGRRVWLFWLIYTLLTVAPVTILQQLSNGWFFYYTYHIASINPIEFGRILNFVGHELFGLMAGLSAMALGAVLFSIRQRGWPGFWRQPWFIWIGLAILISALGRASVGGNLNNRMMAYTLLCLAPGLLMDSLSGYAKHTSPGQLSLIAVLILAQFALGIYNPLRYSPTPEMRHSGDRLIEQIAAEEGEVLVLMHPYYAWRAGKAPSAQIAAMWHARERGTLPLPPDFAARLKNQYYVAVISDNSLFETEPELQQLLNTYYTPAEDLSPAEAPPTSSGMIVQPEVVYRPKH